MSISVLTRSSPPVADLYITEIPSGCAYLWVWRMWENREVRVRGDAKTAILGTEARLEDYDLPVSRPVAYRVQCFAANGTELAGPGPSTPVTVSLDDPSTAWISDPIAPALSRLVALDAGSDGSRTYETETTYAQVMGHEDPVAISGSRSSASDWAFVIKSYSHEESSALHALFLGGGTVLIRADQSVVRHNTGLIYLSAPTITEAPRFDLRDFRRADWTLTGRQVRPPGLSVVMPVREYIDVRDERPDYQATLDAFPDYLSVLRG